MRESKKSEGGALKTPPPDCIGLRHPTYNRMINTEQLTEYLDSNRLLYELQSGFAHHFQLTLVLFTYQILLGNSKQWINSYLSGRKQLVNIADTNLDFRNVLCGVP